jgi:pimeloyl-ACP methyl ester carboxylesterase
MPTLQRGNFTAYYEDTGSGDPLVLICGISADLTVWNSMLPELSTRYRVITFDNRGAGRSSAPDEPYSMQLMADDLNALLDHLQIASTYLLGWSMGGLIAQTFAASHPRRIKHLVLLGTMLAPDGMFKNSITNWLNVRHSNMSPEQMARYLARTVCSPEQADNTQMYDAGIQAMVNNPDPQSLHGFERQAEALLRYTELPEIAEIRMPVSVMVGEHDQLVPPYLSKRLATKLTAGEVRILPGAHAGFVEHPTEYVRAIAEAFTLR